MPLNTPFVTIRREPTIKTDRRAVNGVLPRPEGVARYSLAGTLAPAARHAAASLLPPAERERLLRVAGLLPAVLTRAAYLECRLGAVGGPVDLIFRVEQAGAEILAGRNPRVDPAPLLGHGPAWAAVGALCRAWVEGAAPHWRAVQHLWLELDLDDAPGDGRLPAPSVFVALDERVTVGGTAGAAGELLEAVLAPLRPGGMDPATRTRLQEVLSRRPPAAAVPYVGVMLSRSRAPIRLYLSRICAEGIPATLHDVGWAEGAVAEMEETVEAIRTPDGPRIGMLHVDLLDGALLPRLGLEFTFRRRPQLRGRMVEGPFLDRLVERGLAAPERRAALDAWPGGERRTLRHELWPSWLLRRVNCVKLVLDAEAEPQAKAYLLAFHQPALRRGPAQ